MFIWYIQSSKKSNQKYFICNGRGIAFDGGFWSFDNDLARNVNFGVDNSSLSHIDNQKNSFLVLGEGPTDGFIDRTGAAEKKLVLFLVKQRQIFALIYIVMVMRVTCM